MRGTATRCMRAWRVSAYDRRKRAPPHESPVAERGDLSTRTLRPRRTSICSQTDDGSVNINHDRHTAAGLRLIVCANRKASSVAFLVAFCILSSSAKQVQETPNVRRGSFHNEYVIALRHT